MRPLFPVACAVASLFAQAGWSSAEPGPPTAERWMGGFKHPVDLEWGSDGSLYVAELVRGEVLRISEDGTVSEDPVLRVNVTYGGERGLLGMALDPVHRGRVWVYYTAPGGSPSDPPSWRGKNVVAWFENGVEHVVLEAGGAFMHNGGRLAFDPSGSSIYVAVGDASGRENAQNLETINGKIVRIGRDGAGVEGNFRDRIVSYGHRNVYGLAVDPATGIVMATENSNGQNDEVNLIEGGKNYGWPLCEGTRETDRRAPCAAEQSPPLFEYASTIAPTGASWLRGDFYFAAFNKGDIHRIHRSGEEWRDDVVYHHPDTPRILDVTPGPEGNTLYFSVWTIRDNPDDSEGQIWRLTFPGLPADRTLPSPESPSAPPESLALPGPAPFAILTAALAGALVRRRPREAASDAGGPGRRR